MKVTSTTSRPMKRWIVARTRPGDGAPSISLSFEAGSPNIALIRFLERYGQQPQGSRVDIRPVGAHPANVAASYVKGPHVWEPQS